MDGVTDNRTNLQNAINSLYPKGGGSLYFPDGTCYWSGQLDVTGRNITFFSDANAKLLAGPDEIAKKFNVSGARNIKFDGFTIDAGRTGNNSYYNQFGFISTINTDNISVTNCNLLNSINSLIYLGGGTRFANVTNNYFTGHFCGIYSYVNPGEKNSEKFIISNNRFGESWVTGDVGESACIKLQSHPSLTGASLGHVISNNAIDSSVEMGVELWKGGIGNVVSNNTIRNTFWGISIDQQEYCSVVGNTVSHHPYAGIEAAAFCKYSSIVGNTINAYASGVNSTTRYTLYPIIVSNVTCENTIVSDNIIAGGTNGIFLQACENTNLNNNIIRDCNVSLDLQAASLVKAHGNLFETGYSQTVYHVFFDAASRTLSGFHFTNNKFRGATTNQSIFFYNPTTGFITRDVCFENNVTDETSAGGFGYMVDGASPTNYVFRNNFGPSGSNASNSIPDGSDLTPYGTTNVANAYQFYYKTRYVFTGAVSSTSGAWMKILHFADGNIDTSRFVIRSDTLNPPYTYDNRQENLEFYISQSPYGGNGVITVESQATYAGGGNNIVFEVATNNAAPDNFTDVWINISSGSSAVSGMGLYIYGSNSALIANPTLQYALPNFSANAVRMNLINTARSNFKTSHGIQLGAVSEIYSPSSGVLSVPNGRLGIGTVTPNSALQISGKLFVGTNDADAVEIYSLPGEGGTIKMYGDNGSNLHLENYNGNLRMVNSAFTAEVFTVTQAGNGYYAGRLGVGTSTPAFGLHVTGSVGFSGIATSTTASVGAATLPANPVGFVTINITGGNFKIPYYNL